MCERRIRVTGKKVKYLSMVKGRIRDGGGIKGGAECFFDSFGQVCSGEFFSRGILVTEHNVTCVMCQLSNLSDKSFTSVFI